MYSIDIYRSGLKFVKVPSSLHSSAVCPPLQPDLHGTKSVKNLTKYRYQENLNVFNYSPTQYYINTLQLLPSIYIIHKTSQEVAMFHYKNDAHSYFGMKVFCVYINRIPMPVRYLVHCGIEQCINNSLTSQLLEGGVLRTYSGMLVRNLTSSHHSDKYVMQFLRQRSIQCYRSMWQ